MAKLNINGSPRDVEVEADTPLLWVIREQVGLTGTKLAVGGAMRRLLRAYQRRVMRSCSLSRRRREADRPDRHHRRPVWRQLHPVQKAWLALDVPQCGYCQSGQIMAAAGAAQKNPKPSDADIDAAMTNICRCGTYQRIARPCTWPHQPRLGRSAMTKKISGKSAKISAAKIHVARSSSHRLRAGGGLASASMRRSA